MLTNDERKKVHDIERDGMTRRSSGSRRQSRQMEKVLVDGNSGLEEQWRKIICKREGGEVSVSQGWRTSKRINLHFSQIYWSFKKEFLTHNEARRKLTHNSGRFI